eukprot:CFRG4895T1
MSKAIVTLSQLHRWGTNSVAQKIFLFRGDSTILQLDAIVNAANERMLGGGGIDGAIHRAAGPQLREECYTVPEVKPNVRCPTGEARLTKGYKLPSKFVIHTVGPIGEQTQKLRSCYTSCLDLAKANGIRSLAFCAISTGVYGYPIERASDVAVSTVKEWLEESEENRSSIDGVVFTVFSEYDESVYFKALSEKFPHDQDNNV